MEEVLHYLSIKNQYYEKFLWITRKFLDSAEKGEWGGLSFFVANRERILNILRTCDQKIARLFGLLEMDQERVVRYRGQVRSLLEERERIAREIVDTDLQLISRIEAFKSNTIRELKKALSTQSQLNAYDDSGNLPSKKKCKFPSSI